MTGDKSRFTSDKRLPGSSSWGDEEDWQAGLRSNVGVIDDGIFPQRVEGPRTGFYLDGWADEKLSSRSGYSAVPLESQVVEPGAIETDFKDPSRPEWTIDSGSVTAEGGQLTVAHGGTRPKVSTASSGSVRTWEFEFQLERVGSRNHVFYLEIDDMGNYSHSENGYRVRWGEGGSVVVERRRDGSTVKELLSGSWEGDANPHVLKVVYERPTWELFVDGVSQGTEDDDTYSIGNEMGFTTFDTKGNEYSVNWFSVY